MRVVHLSTFDVLGGASKAAWRLHRALLEAGADSRMLVHRKDSDDETVEQLARPLGALSYLLPHAVDRAAIHLLGYGAKAHRTPALIGRHVLPRLRALKPDVVHLHWVQAGYLRPETLPRLPPPLVWTLHDQWPAGGAQHFAREPDQRLDRWVLRRKEKAFPRISSLALIAPSRWMEQEARRSPLFAGRGIEVIPNAIDVETFRPRPRAEARRALGLDVAGSCVLFASGRVDDPRKGFDRLVQALAGPGAPRLLVAGAGSPKQLPPGAVRLGFVDEHRLALACSAADAVVCPSEEDNLPNVAIEALACGTPVVAFDVGGFGDVVDHRKTGWLAPPGDAAGLTKGMAWASAQGDSTRDLARAAAKARYAPAVVAGRHLGLYRKVLENG